MLTHTLIKLFTRDLKALKHEVSAYSNEKKLWLVPDGISNSAGNLCLHLVGNLNHFIGATIGNTGYVRQRDLEFSLKDVPRKELLKQVDDTITVVEKVLKSLPEADLQKEYKRRAFEDYMTTEYFLVHLTMHLAYHLGQINYHRRLLDN
nr:DinB family protein [uncultured Psychroserpens sp.]